MVARGIPQGLVAQQLFGAGALGGITAGIASTVQPPTTTPTTTPEPTPTPATAPAPASDPVKDYYDWLKGQQRRDTEYAVKAAFEQYGLGSLFPKIVQYAQMDYTADQIVLFLRQTPEYKQRFPAMAALQEKGRAITEAEYVGYEKSAASIEQRYGFPTGFLTGHVTDMLSNEMSVNEMNDRALLASSNSLDAPQDLKDTLRDYYGIDQNGIAAYYFDPEKALPLLQKQYAVTQIGTEAKRQGLGVGVQTAADLQAMGVDQQEARAKMGDASRAMAFTEGRGETTNQEGVLFGTFGREGDQQQLRRIAGSREGRFQAGGGFAGDQKGMTGLGSA